MKMSKELFPECPLTELPSSQEILEEIFCEINLLDDSFLKARLAVMMIQFEHESLENDIKNRTGLFEKILGYVDAVDSPDKREEAYESLISEVCATITYESCCDALSDIAKQSCIPGLCEKIIIRDYADLLKELDQLSKDDPHYQDLLTKLIVNDISRGQWDAAVTKLRQLKNPNDRAWFFRKLVSHQFISESTPSCLVCCIAEMHYLLLVLLRDNNPNGKIIQRLVRALVNCYIHTGAFEAALAMLNDPCFSIYDFHIEESLFEKMLAYRGKEETYAVFQEKCDAARKEPLSYENYSSRITSSHIADAIGMSDLSQSLIQEVCDFATDHTSNGLTDEQRSEMLLSLGEHFDIPPGWHQGRKGNRRKSLEMLQLALSAAENITDAKIRQESMIDVAKAFAEQNFIEESLALFRKYHTDHDFVVRFYDKTMFDARGYYRDISDEDKREWGLAQRVSWMKFILFHLRQPDTDAEERISRLIYYRDDLNELHEELRAVEP